VQFLLVVGQQMRPAIDPMANGGSLAPVVEVNGQRRAQGRSRRNGVGLFHQRPLNRHG
jgi:hypothetical protein